MNIFITGASGFVGRRFLSELLSGAAPDWRIRALVRTPPLCADSRVEELPGDLRDIGAYRRELLDSDYVFHLAANATFGSDADYDAVNLHPTGEMIGILKDSTRLRNFVFTSTIGAVDRQASDDCSGPLTAGSAPGPRSRYGESKLAAERLLRESGLPFTIIRPAWVYGQDMRTGSHVNRFVTMVYDGHPVRHLAFPGRVSLIHVRDLAKALVRCIDHPAVVGRTYFGETEAVSIGEILATISAKLHEKRPFQLAVPSCSFLVGRIHAKLPLALANLFVDYLWARDPGFSEDFRLESPVRFIDGVEDVIRTNIRLAGKWVITGANSGIGFALAERLARSGKRLVLIDKETGNLSRFAAAKIIRADLSSDAEIDAVGESLAKEKIACLVNNAGFGLRGRFRDVPVEAIRRIIAVNAVAPVLLTRKLIGNLVENEAVIVNVASSVAYNPLPFMSLYSATKALVSNWSESITYEMRKTNTVITFSPSGTLTGFQRSANVKVWKGGKGLLSPEFVAERIHDAILRRKRVVILGVPTRALFMISKFLPRTVNIRLWGKLLEKYR
jgi:short-subunit dehydrogenase/uncharacterized protein YbjT (DUF2867 family)